MKWVNTVTCNTRIIFPSVAMHTIKSHIKLVGNVPWVNLLTTPIKNTTSYVDACLHPYLNVLFLISALYDFCDSTVDVYENNTVSFDICRIGKTDTPGCIGR